MVDNSTMRNANSSSSGGTGSDSESAAVAELISDILDETRLHITRVLEFLDGTKDDPPVADETQRARLKKAALVLRQAVDGLSALER